MIHEALAFIRRELRDRLPVADNEVTLENARTLDRRNDNLGACISLVNIEEEPTLRNLPAVERPRGAPLRQEPPVQLNLYLLFSFGFEAYETSLRHLSNTIGLFQDMRVYTKAGASPANPLPAGIEKLVFEPTNLNLAALNDLWGVMGCVYLPSVVYKVRMVRVPSAVTRPGGESPTAAGATVAAADADLLGTSSGVEVHRVDLSSILSKYIGETEKNLAALFETARYRGWISHFDEADALFGKRTGDNTAHDRSGSETSSLAGVPPGRAGAPE